VERKLAHVWASAESRCRRQDQDSRTEIEFTDDGQFGLTLPQIITAISAGNSKAAGETKRARGAGRSM